MPVTTTLLSLRQDIARKLWGNLSVVDTTSLGTTTSVVVSDLAYNSLSTNAYDGHHIYIAELVTGGPAIGEIAHVNRGGLTVATGAMAVSPAFSAAVQTGTDIIIHRGIHPDDVLNAINWAQNGLWVPAYLPLTLVTDGDMELNNVTNWAAVVSPTTRAKQTTAARVAIGIRSLNVVTDAVDEGVTSNNIDVHEGEQLLVSVALRVPTGDAAVQLRNVTAGTTIREVAAIDEPAWTNVQFTETVPDNCEQVAIRILSDTVAVSEFDVGYVILLSQDRQDYILPADSQITAVGGQLHTMLYYRRGGKASEDANTYVLEQEYLPWGQVELLQDMRGANANRIQLPAAPDEALFYKFRRSLPDLSADTDTTEAPSLLIVEGALSRLKELQASRVRNEALRRQLLGEAYEHRRNYNQELKRSLIAQLQIVRTPAHRVAL